jgi:hypothetical protein
MSTEALNGLGELVAAVLGDFSGLRAVPAAAGAGPWELCFRAVLPGDKRWLVLRCSRDLARRLAEASLGPGDESLHADAFAELCNLCSSHLADRLPPPPGGWKPFLPEAGLPPGAAEVEAVLEVEGAALEASVWSAA